MTPSRRLAWCLAASLAVATSARAADNKLPAAAQAALDKAEKIELLSLDPKPVAEDVKDAFHRYKVLGKTTLKDADRKSVLKALGDGIRKADPGLAAGCFNPRHGIRAVHDGKTVDLVICFECLSIMVFVDDKAEQGPHVTPMPQGAFDKVLKAAKVPLPGGPGDK